MMSGMTIWGYHPVKEFVMHRPDAIEKIGVIPSFGRRRRDRGLLKVMEKKGVFVQKMPRLQGLGVPEQAVHQGIGAIVSRVWEMDEDAFRFFVREGGPESGLMVACDEITDPHNFGAILRGAVSLGASCVITQSRGSAPVTGVVAKSSSGALAVIKIVQCKRLRHGLEFLKENGWRIIGLDPVAENIIWEEDFKDRVVFVLGSEEKGLRKTIKATCHALCRIPLLGTIHSLNVSQASGIVLYESLRQRN